MNEKKAIMILPERDFRDSEYLDVKNALEEEDFEISVASTSTDIVEGSAGLKVQPDYDIFHLPEGSFDAIIFIGGSGIKDYIDNDDLMQIIRDLFNEKKIIGAISLGTMILANSGMLGGKKATGPDEVKEMFSHKNVQFTGEDLTVDGNIITAKSFEAALRFGKTIAKLA